MSALKTNTATTPAITAEVMTITPEVATEMLKLNIGNRKMNKRRLTQHVNAMRNGQWMITGEAIKFSDAGRLIDGQHRLTSVVESGATIQSMVVRGIPDMAQVVIDYNYPRSNGQALGSDVRSATNKAAAAKLMFGVELGLDPRLGTSREMVGRVDVKLYYEANRDDIDSAARIGHFGAQDLYVNVGGNLSAWIAFIAFANKISPTALNEFLTGLRTGAGLSEGDPRLAMRNFYSRQAAKRFRGLNYFHLGLLIKAWNDWMSGTERNVVIFRDVEAWPEMKTKRSLESRSKFS